MPCIPFTTPEGGRGFACTVRRAKACSCGSRRTANLLCDWKDPSRSTGTCDQPLCSSCTSSPAPGKDLCPTHAEAWAARQARKANP